MSEQRAETAESAEPTSPPVNGRGSIVQSVDRALSIMEILARDGWSSVTDIARELEVHKSTVFRLVATMQRRGIVEQHAASQKYRLGFAMVRLASGIRGEPDLVEVARPTLELLSEELDETVDLAVMEEGEVTNIDQASLSTSIVSVDWVGHRTPMHVAASGKVFLAFADESEREAFLRQPLERVTDRTVTDPAVLRAQLEETRERGYAITMGELEEGLNALAAPIRSSDGSIIAVIVVSGPEYRMTEQRIPEAALAVREAAASVSRQLGWVGHVTAPPDDIVVG
jgi:DNA-binding IclR family transcriptional regulator